MNRKYKLTTESIDVNGHTLYRIKAVRSFGNVKAGDLGGFVEYENNLSHAEACWVSDDARVYGNARISGFNAHIYENATIYGDAWVGGIAKLYGNAEVYGNTHVYGDARVYGNARICGNARIHQQARVHGDTHIFGFVRISGNAQVYGNAWVGGDTYVYLEMDTDLDHGIWTRQIIIDGKFYLLSSTLEKILSA